MADKKNRTWVLNLKVDVAGLELPPPDLEKTPQELMVIVVHNLMYQFAKNGLTEGNRRSYYKLVTAMEEASKAKLETVELSEEQASFLRQAKRECVMVPNRLLERVEGLIERMQEKE